MHLLKENHHDYLADMSLKRSFYPEIAWVIANLILTELTVSNLFNVKGKVGARAFVSRAGA